uniref:Anoctamin dimerisation domain-containing protein n=1 Tax=Anopheles maculatus TaxID=74869 RepID=A0A182T1C5_9DIPT
MVTESDLEATTVHTVVTTTTKAEILPDVKEVEHATDPNPIGEPPAATEANRTHTWKYFKDQRRIVDYVLAFNGEDENVEAKQRRAIYQRNLENEGLQIETENCQRIHFVKIHVPEQVLSHYCEIMK